MNISNPIPVSLPVSVANLPTEAVETQNRVAQRVPESRQTLENSRNRASQSSQQTNESERAARNAEIRERILGSDEQPDNTGQRDGKSQNSDNLPFPRPGQRSESAQSASSNSNGSAPETGPVRTGTATPVAGTQNSDIAEAGPDPAQLRREQRQQAAEQATIRELAAIDRKVKAHEQAHASVGGVYAGSPSFTYKTGPNGVRYAVGGEVPIDISAVPGNPQATLRKAEQVRRAALAPADPSPTDRRVAATAQAIATKARFEIARLRAEQGQGGANGVTINDGRDDEQALETGGNNSFTATKLFAALATDATEQVGGQVNASA